MFPDPYKTALDQDRIKEFQAMAKTYFGEEDDEEMDGVASSSSSHQLGGNDGFMEDEDPEWFRKKYPHLR